MDSVFDFDEEQGNVVMIKRVENKPNVREMLADLVLERLLPKALRAALIKGTADHFVITVPSVDWQVPIGEALVELRETIHPVFPGTAKTAGDDRRVVRQYLEAEHTLIGVAVTVGSLPSLMRTIVSQTFVVPPLDGKLIGTLLKSICKGPAPRSINDINFSLLDFDEICALVQVGASTVDVVEKLARAVAGKTSMARTGERLPDMDEAVEFGLAQKFAKDLKIDLDDVRAGRIGWHDVDAGIVLHGPSGTGKTTFARSLGEYLGIPVVIGSVAELFAGGTGYLDNIIKAQRAVFETARSAAPCVLFLDEIDQIPNLDQADSRNRDYWAPVVADFLTLLDGAVSERHGVIVVGATNRIHAIAPAVLRPGRLERAVYLGPADAEGCARILRHHLRTDLLDEDIDRVATTCAVKRLTGAEIMDVVRTARRRGRRGNRDMTVVDLQEALSPGGEMQPDLQHRIAVHEAGHALLGALYFPDDLVKVSIEPRQPDNGGQTEFFRPAGVYTRRELAHRVELLLSGRAAEILLCGSPSTGSGGQANSDLGQATQILASSYLSWGTGDQPRWRCRPEDTVAYLVHDKRVRDRVERSVVASAAQALVTLTHYRSALTAISNRLVQDRTLSRTEVVALLNANPPLKAASSSSRTGAKIIPLISADTSPITNA